jgi:hypothetical protein
VRTRCGRTKSEIRRKRFYGFRNLLLLQSPAGGDWMTDLRKKLEELRAAAEKVDAYEKELRVREERRLRALDEKEKRRNR